MLDIDNPTLDFVALAKGMGMGATRVATAEDLCRAIECGFAEPGPTLIEAVL
jgi:acetolactate synthase-1/2/3 large subunit